MLQKVEEWVWTTSSTLFVSFSPHPFVTFWGFLLSPTQHVTKQCTSFFNSSSLEGVDGHNHRNTKGPGVLHLLPHVAAAPLHQLQVLPRDTQHTGHNTHTRLTTNIWLTIHTVPQ